MGRLFWKFFFAFWLALLAASGGVGAAVWLHQQTLDERGQELASGPRTAFLVNATAATLRHGGMAALRSLLEEWRERGQSGARVYVVDDAGRRIPELRAALQTAGLTFDRLEEIEPTIEDLFVAATSERTL